MGCFVDWVRRRLKRKHRYWEEVELCAPGTIIRVLLLQRFPFCQWNSICDILCPDVRPFLLPSGALLCLGFNGCHCLSLPTLVRRWRSGPGWGGGMGGALLGGMGRGFLSGPTLPLHEGRLLGSGRLPLRVLCWELTPECLQHGLVKKGKSCSRRFRPGREVSASACSRP